MSAGTVYDSVCRLTTIVKKARKWGNISTKKYHTSPAFGDKSSTRRRLPYTLRTNESVESREYRAESTRKTPSQPA